MSAIAREAVGVLLVGQSLLNIAELVMHFKRDKKLYGLIEEQWRENSLNAAVCRKHSICLVSLLYSACPPLRNTIRCSYTIFIYSFERKFYTLITCAVAMFINLYFLLLHSFLSNSSS